MQMNLTALPDDWTLHANGDTERDTEPSSLLFDYYLTDPQGNRLTDPQGNYLVGRFAQVVYAQSLTALPDDFTLNAE